MNDKILVPQSWYSFTGKAEEALSCCSYCNLISSLLNQALSNKRQNKRDKVLANIKFFLEGKGYTNIDNAQKELPSIIKTLDYDNMWSYTVDSLRHLLRVLISYKNEIITIINEKISQSNDEWEKQEWIEKDCDNKEYIKILWNFFDIPSEDFQKLEDLYKEETSEKKKEVHEKRTERWAIDDNMTLEEVNKLWWKFLVDKPSDSNNTRNNKAFLRKNISYWTYKKYERNKWVITDRSSWWEEIKGDEVIKAIHDPSYKIKYINKQEKECEVSLEDVERTKNYLEEIAILCKIKFLENRLYILINHSEIFLKHGQDECILIFFDDDINKLNIENNDLLKWGEELWWGKFLSLYLGISSLIANLEVGERSKKMQDFISFIREKWINKANEFIEKEQKKVVDWVVSKIKKQKRRGNNFWKINTSDWYNPWEIIEGIPRMFELIQTLGIWEKIKEYLKPSDSFAEKSRFGDDDELRQRKETSIIKERLN